MGGEKAAQAWHRRALRAALTTSALVEPTSMTSICGVTKCLMDLRVALGGRNRHGQQNEVSPGHGQQGRGRFHIDHAHLRAQALVGGGHLL